MGRTIVITGAGDGLGRALARRFARDGETVILLGRTLAKVEAVAAELGAPHFALACDIADPDQVRKAFATIAGRFAHIDALINNAGVFMPFTLAEATDHQVRDLIDINIAGTVFCSREALPLLRGGGHIINVTSESSALKMPMMSLYAGTKHAVELMSEMWASELEDERVRVTVVRAGQMYDETKTAPPWPPELALRFGKATAKVGINLRERGLSHYNSAVEVFRAVLDTPPDIHIGIVTLNAVKR